MVLIIRNYFLYLYSMQDVNKNNCGNHFTIMLYTLNLHSDEWQYISIKLEKKEFCTSKNNKLSEKKQEIGSTNMWNPEN